MRRRRKRPGIGRTQGSPLTGAQPTKNTLRAFFLGCGDPGGSRTHDFLDENQTSWTTRRRDHLHPILTESRLFCKQIRYVIITAKGWS